MRWITIILIFISLNCFSQNISQIKHLETISEITDTMALINKQDIDKINRTYFIKNKLDSLNCLNEAIIRELNVKVAAQDSIIFNQLWIISNKDYIILEYKNKHDELIANNLKQIKKEQRKSRIFKIFSASELAIIAILACFL